MAKTEWRVAGAGRLTARGRAQVPLFDTEVVSVYGLRALGGVAFKDSAHAQYRGLFDKGSDAQFVFVGGKGGVGKTSTSSALGVRLADAGLKTLIISTDPAHSLGDCLATRLEGHPTEVQGTDGNLWAMEVDTEEALERFKENLRGVSRMGGRLGELGNKIGLDEFAELLENPPPGTDEVVALGDVMEVMREGKFDRVIVDTAPTGHTLRLLSFPDFLDGFLQKVLGIKRKLDGAINTAKALFGMSGADGGRDEVEEAAAAVERQRVKAVELRELLTDPARTQFLVVSIATQLAFAESERLVQGLAERGVAVDNLVVNQLLGEAANEAWVHRVAKAQGKSIEGIRAMTDQAMLAPPPSLLLPLPVSLLYPPSLAASRPCSPRRPTRGPSGCGRCPTSTRSCRACTPSAPPLVLSGHVASLNPY